MMQVREHSQYSWKVWCVLQVEPYQNLAKMVELVLSVYQDCDKAVVLSKDSPDGLYACTCQSLSDIRSLYLCNVLTLDGICLATALLISAICSDLAVGVLQPLLHHLQTLLLLDQCV